MCYADNTELLCSLVVRRVGVEPGGGSSGCAEVADRRTFYRVVICVYGVYSCGVAAVCLYCDAYVAARALQGCAQRPRESIIEGGAGSDSSALSGRCGIRTELARERHQLP